MKPATAMELIKTKMADPNIRSAIAGIYDEVGEFTLVDAVKKHVEHIQGVEHEVVTKQGDVVTVRAKPSYPALKDFLTMTLPQPAKKLEVGMTVAAVGQSMLADVPPVAARALGPAIVSESVEALTVEFKDEEEGEDGS